MIGTEHINDALRDHQTEVAISWRLHPTIAQLHRFFDLFNEQLFDAGELPPAAISLDRTRCTRLGHYVPGRNGIGLRHNINLNRTHLGQLSLLRQLEVLCHEMVHQWQELYGHPPRTGWYHNKEFCQEATRIGIVTVPPHGRTVRLTDPFLALCRRHGVDDAVPAYEVVGDCQQRVEGASTLKRWFCGCRPPVNVRVAVPDFDATCNRCGDRFRLS